MRMPSLSRPRGEQSPPRLPLDEGGLTLWKYEVAGYESICRVARPGAEQYERLVERVLVTVGTSEPVVGLSIGAENVIVDEEMVVSERLSGLRVVSDYDRVVADFKLWEYYADLHSGPPDLVSHSLYASGVWHANLEGKRSWGANVIVGVPSGHLVESTCGAVRRGSDTAVVAC